MQSLILFFPIGFFSVYCKLLPVCILFNLTLANGYRLPPVLMVGWGGGDARILFSGHPTSPMLDFSSSSSSLNSPRGWVGASTVEQPTQ